MTTHTILVTNDDGIHSEALQELAWALSAIANVVIVAPDINQSACSRKITMDEPLRIEQVSDMQGKVGTIERYTVTGTTVDCVHIGVHHILKDNPPNMIASGINKGLNIGNDIHYSGTVGGAIAGSHYGIPSFAISQEMGPDTTLSTYRTAAYFARLTAELLMHQLDWNTDVILNVNCPKNVELTSAYIWCQQGKRIYDNQVRALTDPRGRAYYWIGDGGTTTSIPDPGTDCAGILDGHVTITPVTTNQTCTETLVKHWDRTFRPTFQSN